MTSGEHVAPNAPELPWGAWAWFPAALAVASLRWRRTCVLALLGAAALAFPQIGKLRPAWGPERFLPPENKALREFQRLERLFGLAEPAFAVIECREPGHGFELKHIAELFAQIASEPRLVERTQFRAERVRLAYHLDPAAPEFVHFMAAEDWDAIDKRLEPEAIDARAAAIRRQARTLSAGRGNLREDPLDLFGPLRARIFESLSPLALSPRDRYFLSEDGQSLAVVLTPRLPAGDARFCLELMEHLEASAEAALASRSLSTLFSIRFAGRHARVASEIRLYRFELARTSALAAALWLAFALAAFRRLAALIALAFPLACLGVALAGLAGAFLGEVTIFGLSAFLLAMTAEAVFATQLYSRYIEEAAIPNSTLRASVERAAAAAGASNAKVLLPALVVSGIMAGGGAPAWREFALIACGGLVLAWLAAHSGAPAVIGIAVNERASRAVSRRFSNFGLRYMASAAVLQPRLTLALAVIATCYLARHAVEIGAFPPDGKAALSSSGREPSREVAGGFRLPSARLLATVEAPALPETLEANDLVHAGLRAVRDDLGVSSIVSARTLLPGKPSQYASRKRALKLDLDALEARLREAAAKEQLNYSEIFAPSVETLKLLKTNATLARLEIEWGAIASARYSQLVRDLVKRSASGSCLALTEVWLERSPSESDLLGLAEALRTATPKARLGGRVMAQNEAWERLRTDVARAAFAGGAVALLSVALALGGSVWAALALGSGLAAIAAAAGVLKLWGVEPGLPELLLAPSALLLGFASNAYIVLRFRECRPFADQITVLEARDYNPPQRACLFSAVRGGRPSAVAAIFFFLVCATCLPVEHEGLHRLGVSGAVAIACFVFGAQTLLPALLALREAGLVPETASRPLEGRSESA